MMMNEYEHHRHHHHHRQRHRHCRHHEDHSSMAMTIMATMILFMMMMVMMLTMMMPLDCLFVFVGFHYECVRFSYASTLMCSTCCPQCVRLNLLPSIRRFQLVGRE